MRVLKSLIALIVLAAAAVGLFLFISSQEKQSSPISPESAVIINEFLTSNSTVLPDDGGNYSDWIELYNPTDSEADLTGFGLSDDNKRAAWMFPAMQLPAKSYMVIFASGADISKVGALYQHTNFKLNSSEGGVYLFNEAGELSDKIEYKRQTENVSMGRNPQNLSEVTIFTSPTPGFSNDEAGAEAFAQSRLAQGSTLFITEVNPSNKTSFADNKGNLSDYIEIYNAGAQAVELNGYGLSDDVKRVLKWKFPAVTIQPGAYMAVFASGEGDGATDASAGAVHTNFRISAYRESLVLSDPAGFILDQVSISEMPQGASYSRAFRDGAYQQEWEISNSPTPGAQNGAAQQ